MKFLEIDGSLGEGGGQVLRSSLSLALVTGIPFRIHNIRARRKNPGLLRQHLTAVEAAVKISGSEVAGANPGSRKIEFIPGKVLPGSYSFAVGTAGSATLVLQTILPAFLTASAESRLSLEGGTHNPNAPPYDYLEKAFIPFLRKMGPQITSSLGRPGFYPAGGGRFVVSIKSSRQLAQVDITERGELRKFRATAMVSGLSEHIARRELDVVRDSLGWPPEALVIKEVHDSAGPGNALILELVYEQVGEYLPDSDCGASPLRRSQKKRSMRSACIWHPEHRSEDISPTRSCCL